MTRRFLEQGIPAIFGSLLLAATLVLPLMLLTSCPDDSAEMARQIRSGGSRPDASQTAPRERPSESATSPAAPAAAENGEVELAGGDEPAAGEEPVAEEAEYTGPVINVEVVEIKPPYPMFEGTGRYDIEITAQSEEFLAAKVCQIIALDAEGTEVGRQQQMLKIPHHKPRAFIFNAFYCETMPISIEIRWTEEDAAAVGEEGREEAANNDPRGGGSKDSSVSQSPS